VSIPLTFKSKVGFTAPLGGVFILVELLTVLQSPSGANNEAGWIMIGLGIAIMIGALYGIISIFTGGS
jgi:hypothetical protein